MVSCAVTIATHDVSNYVKRIMISSQAMSPVSSFQLFLENSGYRFDNTFDIQNLVDILVNNISLLKGYLDKAKPDDKSLPEATVSQLFQILGRNFGQDLDNKNIDKSYPPDEGDDIIDDMLQTAGSEVTYTSPHTGPLVAYEATGEPLAVAITRILEQEGYHALVDENKQLQHFALGSIDSGILLKCIAQDPNNNILELSRDEVDGLEIKNNIKVYGRMVEDGWSDGNAQHFSGLVGNIISDEKDLAYLEDGYGAAGIRCDKGSAAQCVLKLNFPLYNYTKLAFRGGEVAYSIYAKDVSDPTQTFGANIYLKDESGNEIRNVIDLRGLSGPGPYRFSMPVGPEIVVGANKPWYPSVGTWALDSWEKIVEIRFETSNLVDFFVLDAMTLPIQMIAVASDPISQGKYLRRDWALNRLDLFTQKQLDDFVAMMLAKRKEKLTRIKVWAVGTAGLIGGMNKWIPGYKLKVNYPAKGINNAYYKMVTVNLYVDDRPILEGFDFIAEVSLIPLADEHDIIRWDLNENPQFATLRIMQERLRSVMSGTPHTRDWTPTPPRPLRDIDIDDGAITTPKLVDDAITGPKIKASEVTTRKLNVLGHYFTNGPNFVNNSPSPGYVSWTAFYGYYGGVMTAIGGGNTNKKYIYWTAGSSSLSSSDTKPSIDADQILMAYNDSGTITQRTYNKGGTTIEGSLIKTGTVKADEIYTGAVMANRISASHLRTDTAVITQTAQIANAIIDNVNIKNDTLTFSKVDPQFGKDSFLNGSGIVVSVDAMLDYSTYYRNISGSASAIFSKNRIVVQSGTTNPSNISIGGYEYLEASRNPWFKCKAKATALDSDGNMFRVGTYGWNTTCGFFFSFEKVSGTVKLRAYVWTPGEFYSIDLMDATLNQFYILQAKLTYGVKVEFYVDGVLKGTITELLPTGSMGDVFVQASNNAASNASGEVRQYQAMEEWQ